MTFRLDPNPLVWQAIIDQFRTHTMATAYHFYNEEVPFEFAKYLKDWMDGSNTVTILVIGETGSGKSTLINSVLGFSKVIERPALVRKDYAPLKIWKNTIGNTQVSMWDSPGLGLPPTDKNKVKTVEDIRRNCRDVDLCLFCIDMSNVRIAPEYGEIMKEFNEILGGDIWKKTMFILTYANKFLIQIDEEHLDDPEGKKQAFEEQVELWKRKLPIQLQKHVNLDPQISMNVKIVPVGHHRSHQLLFPDDNVRWVNDLWLQAVSAIQHNAKPAAVKICQHLVRSTENDPTNSKQLSITLTMQENSETSYAYDHGQELTESKG